MNFIRRYWFGLLTGIFIFLFFVLFILILLAPRQDLQRRGFIPCTEIMAEQLLSCETNKVSCLLSAVMQNSWCDIKVVGHGISNWISGHQKAPWSNYLFEPELPQDDSFDAAARAEYLKSNPDFAAEMLQLQQLSEELENEEINEPEISAEEQPQDPASGLGPDGHLSEPTGSAGGEGPKELQEPQQVSGSAL